MQNLSVSTLQQLSLSIPMPKIAHFFAFRQQFIERAFGFDFAILEHDDVIGTTECWLAVRDHETGCLVPLENSLPEQLFCFHIQRAG